MPTFSGIHHVAPTVTDLAVSVPVYEKVPQMSPTTTMAVGPFTRQVRPARRAGPGTHPAPARQRGRFDATVPGLDHLGLSCATRQDVVAWAEHLDRVGVGVAHSGVRDADYGTAVSFTDPDGNALEFFAAA